MNSHNIHIIGSSSDSSSRSNQVGSLSRYMFPTYGLIEHPHGEKSPKDIKNIVDSPSSKIVFFDPDNTIESSSAKNALIKMIRKIRKDIFVVAFDDWDNAHEDEQYIHGLKLLKETSSNLVLGSDGRTGTHMIIAPEEARYHVGHDIGDALTNLVDMTRLRSALTFTRSTVIGEKGVPWDSPKIYPSLKEVVEFCIREKAYKPFMGSTAGHFAVKLDEKTFLTSKRKTDFNALPETGLIEIVTNGPDEVLAYGGRPSVGGQSQRIIFAEYPELDSIVHFHSPLRPGSQIPTVSQRAFECGSHECGQNTANGLRHIADGIHAVYLDNHGPNIVFHHGTQAKRVTEFIGDTFDLSRKTDGSVERGI